MVLFMAASTKPPKLCIVMEYMALGALFDVIFLSLRYMQINTNYLIVLIF